MSERPSLKPAYGIWGEDRGKVDRAVRRLVDRVAGDGGMPPDSFDAAVDPAGDVVAACESLSFGGLRLVIVRGAEAWRAADAAPLVDYLDRPSPATCLAVVAAGQVTPRLVSAIEAAGDVLAYGPDSKAKRGDRAKWFANHVAAECERAGAKLPAPLARLVVERVGEDAMALAQEAAKLAAAAGREPIDRGLIDALVVEHPEAKAYELADALTQGARRRVYELLDDLGEGDHPTDPAVIQSTLARHFRAIAVAQAMGPGASADDLGEATGLRGYPAQKALEQARALDEGAGDQCVSRLAALELDLRVHAVTDLGRSSLDGRRFMLELAARDLLVALRH